MGRGEGSPLYDPGSKLYYWEGESNAIITINEMGKRKVKCITAAVIIRYPSKLHRSTRSGLTAVLCIWPMYNFSSHTQRTCSVTLLAPCAWLNKNIIKNALDTFRRQTKGSVGVRSDLSDRNLMKLGIGFT